MIRFLERALLLVCLYYPLYRYPFQIGDSVVSSGYKDTPLVLQVGKYLLIGGLAFAMLCVTLLRRPQLSLHRLVMIICALYIGMVPLLMLPQTGHLASIESGLWWLCGAVLLLLPTSDPGRFVPTLRFFAWFALAFTILQVVLFVTIGRLPAVSIDDSFAIRFGSAWDDPNGFAIMFCLLIPLGWLTLRGFKRLLFGLLSVAALLATQSLTGVGAFGVSVVIGTLVLFAIGAIRARLWTLTGLMLTGGIGLAAGGFVGWWLWSTGIIDAYLALKAGSIEGHMAGVDMLLSADWPALMGLQAANTWGEMGYVNWLTNFGLFYTLTHVALLAYIATHVALNARRSTGDTRAFHAAVFYFLLAYMAGQINLPLDYVFPVNMLAIFLSAASVRMSEEWRLRSPERQDSWADASTSVRAASQFG